MGGDLRYHPRWEVLSMADTEKLVAIVSPWKGLGELVKQRFRIESLPAEKKVMVWREDLQTKRKLERELADLGIEWSEIEKRRVTAKWRDID
jgi:hypothetical protein